MRCVIAGGGTGGHLFPGMAVAEAFIKREMGNEVLFVGTERGIEKRVLAGGKFPLKTISAMPLKGKSFLGKIKALWSIPKAVLEAFSLLKDFRPEIVLGVGGYASGPTVLAAFLLRMKRAIHEQNMVPGLTNRILKWFSQRIFVSFEETRKHFPGGKTVVTGNPVRREIVACLPERNGNAQETKEKKGGRFTLLVFGGSAGARRINEAVMEALDQLKDIRSSLKFFHQTGRDDVEFVSKAYEEKGFDALVSPFFEKMADYYQISDLAICRAGAGTISELAVCGKAAILIPYPHAAHHHQLVNAQKLVGLGAARMIREDELSGISLARTISQLYSHPEERRRMEESIRKVARPKAAEEIVDHCYDLVGKTD